MKANDLEFSRSQWESKIDEWIFNEEDRKMLKRRLLDGIVFERLAEEFNLSVDQTKKRVYRAEKNLFKRL